MCLRPIRGLAEGWFSGWEARAGGTVGRGWPLLSKPWVGRVSPRSSCLLLARRAKTSTWTTSAACWAWSRARCSTGFATASWSPRPRPTWRACPCSRWSTPGTPWPSTSTPSSSAGSCSTSTRPCTPPSSSTPSSACSTSTGRPAFRFRGPKTSTLWYVSPFWQSILDLGLQ